MDTLNLGFSENVLRVLRVNDQGIAVLQKEMPLDFNLSDDENIRKNKDEIVHLFAVKFSELRDENSLTAIDEVSVLIDTSQAFLNVFPLDLHEDKDSINSHILWELSNYFPENYKDFNVRYYRLNNKFPAENIDEILLIAVDKNKIDLLKSLCNESGLKIKMVDIDQFAVEKCIREFYPEELKKSSVLLIGCKNSRFDFSLLVNGKIRYYDYENVYSDNFRPAIVKQMNFFNSEFNNHLVEKIFLYGEGNTSEVLNFIGEEFLNLPIILVDPTSNGNKDEDTSRYSPLYGLALKNSVTE